MAKSKRGPTATESPDGGTCHDLGAADIKRVVAFMAAVARAFELADPDLLAALSHEGDDPRSRRNSHQFDKSLMRAGHKVRGWSARPYAEPRWGIMRELRHHPPPSVWVDVTLNNGKRDYPYCLHRPRPRRRRVCPVLLLRRTGAAAQAQADVRRRRSRVGPNQTLHLTAAPSAITDL